MLITYMDTYTCLIFLVVLLCIAILNNFVMYYKCYLDNDNNDPFVPENVGKYQIAIYYNKSNEPGISNILSQYIDPLKTNMYGTYVVTLGKPTPDEYKQIAMLN